MKKDYSYGIIPYYFDQEKGEPMFFIGRRTTREETGFWKFPKGHEEPEDETEIATALRECEEEIGVLFREDDLILDKYFCDNYEYENEAGEAIDKTTYFWLGKIAESKDDLPGITLQLAEFSEFHFVTARDALELLSESGQECFEEAYEYLKKGEIHK